MSKLLQNNTYFLRFILSTTRKQSVLLLENTTPGQALVICEIAYNLLDIPLTTNNQKKQVKKNTILLKKLSKKKTGVKLKQKLISKKSKELYNILKSVEEPLLNII